MLNYGAPEGIGGVASYWMAFLQQAGGTMYGDDGMPVFNDAPGVDALQLMIDLMPFTDPSSISNVGINDATNVLNGWHRVDDDELALHVDRRAEPGNIAIVGELDRRPTRRTGRHRVDRWHRCLDDRLSSGSRTGMKLIDFYLSPEFRRAR